MKYLIFFCSFLLVSCTSNTSDDCVCTDDLRVFSVVVIDNNNNLVDSLITSVTNPATGKVYNFSDSFPFSEGRYTVMTDEQKDDFTTMQEKILFTGQKNSRTVSAEYFFNTDNCRCHVQKVSGPDTLKINLN